MKALELAELRNLENLLEINLGILEKLQHTLEENLSELEEYGPLFNLPEEIIIADKLKAQLRTILNHLEELQEDMENLWEEIELTILSYALNGNNFFSKENLIKNFVCKLDGVLCRLDTLKEFIELNKILFEEDLKKFRLNSAFPYEIYIEILGQLIAFNNNAKNKKT
jgi:hypothetical protein